MTATCAANLFSKYITERRLGGWIPPTHPAPEESPVPAKNEYSVTLNFLDFKSPHRCSTSDNQ